MIYRIPDGRFLGGPGSTYLPRLSGLLHQVDADHSRELEEDCEGEVMDWQIISSIFLGGEDICGDGWLRLVARKESRYHLVDPAIVATPRHSCGRGFPELLLQGRKRGDSHGLKWRQMKQIFGLLKAAARRLEEEEFESSFLMSASTAEAVWPEASPILREEAWKIWDNQAFPRLASWLGWFPKQLEEPLEDSGSFQGLPSGFYWWGPYFAGEDDGSSAGEESGIVFMTSPEGPSGEEPEGTFVGSGPHGPYPTESAALRAWYHSVRTYGRK